MEDTKIIDEMLLDSSLNDVPKEPLYPLPYDCVDNCIAIGRKVNDVWVTTELCNFAAWVEAEIIRDNGVEERRELRITGVKQDGTPLPIVSVFSDELHKMDWMRNGWPTDCNIRVTNSAERHILFAIRSTAERARHEYVFEITGWRKILGRWEYLLPGMCEYAVELSGKQRNYFVERGATDYDLAIGAGLTTLEFIPYKILQPCLAMAFLSPLNEFLRQAECEPKFLLALVGHTGCRKSTLAALVSSFFGRFSATDLPMSFRDTANSITYNAFALKDVLTCVDDYHPVAQRESGNMKATMQTVCRAFGDRAARNGLTSSYKLREARPPQGNAIITAEHIPDVGESAVARLFCIEIPQNCMDLKILSEVQEFASQGVLRRIMWAYINWLKNTFLCNDESVREFVLTLRRDYVARRDRCRRELTEKKVRFHSRTADAVACMEIGYEMMLTFFSSVGMLNADAVSERRERFHSIMIELSAEQTKHVESDRPTHIYIRKLMTLIENGECSILHKDAHVQTPPNFIGYEDEQLYYFSLENSHKMVKRFCNMQDEEFAITARALGKALKDDGYIIPFGENTTKSKYLGGRNYRCIQLKKSVVEEMMRYD